MAMVAVLFPISDSEPKLEAAALEELASLGITSVALLRDSSIAGLVLEGWAFDARDVERAARAVAGAIREIEPEIRTLFTKVVERDPREAAKMLEP